MRRSRAPLSVVLVCHSYPPVIGGSELEAQRVSSALTRRGYRITVVCAGGDPMPPVRDWIDPAGVRVRIYAGRWKGAVKDIVFALRVAGMLIRERRNYQLVYFLMQGLHLALGLPVARFLAKPIVMKVGGSGVIPLMERSRAGRLELRWLRKWAYRVMVLNDGMRAEAIRAGFPDGQLHWMPNPVDTDTFAPAGERRRLELRARFGLPAKAPVVLYVGRLAPEKLLPTLLDAFALALPEAPAAVLVVAGDGPLRTALQQQANRLRLPAEHIRFAGLVDPSEVHLWYQAADVYALLSSKEGFPCALLEAMSAGVASVVSDIPGNRQLIDDGQHGLRVPVEDAPATAAALVRLLADDALRGRMGEAARRRVEDNYSLAKIADRYEDLFEEAQPGT
jgi:glycosyltransferase involved in cell wall biosynthesis